MKVIGLALKKDKCEKHINQGLINKAKAAGFELKVIDPDVPLEEQGRLDAVLQKIRKSDWEAQLEDYALRHPHVKVLDMPAATMSIRHRGTMLDMFEGGPMLFQEPGDWAHEEQLLKTYKVSVPTNTTLPEGTSLGSALRRLQRAGIHYPFLVKPAWADGRPGSHALAVVGTSAGLKQLLEGDAAQEISLPVLVQEYVEHGGCLFKVYVLGSRAVMVKRNSLQLNSSAGTHHPQTSPSSLTPCVRTAKASQQPSWPSSNPHQQAAVSQVEASHTPAQTAEVDPPSAVSASGQQMPFRSADAEPPCLDLQLVQRVSAYQHDTWGKSDLAPKGHGVASPPDWLIEQLAARLRRHLGLTLFNFDVIVPKQELQQGTSRALYGQQPSNCDCERMAGEYHLIDINYFPGYEKLPGYEELMVEFFKSIWAKESVEEET